MSPIKALTALGKGVATGVVKLVKRLSPKRGSSTAATLSDLQLLPTSELGRVLRHASEKKDVKRSGSGCIYRSDTSEYVRVNIVLYFPDGKRKVNVRAHQVAAILAWREEHARQGLPVPPVPENWQASHRCRRATVVELGAVRYTEIKPCFAKDHVYFESPVVNQSRNNCNPSSCGHEKACILSDAQYR